MENQNEEKNLKTSFVKNKIVIVVLVVLGLIGVSIFFYSKLNLQKCDIKGNISGDKIYHLSECLSYDKTAIDESKGEKWFCSEKEAIEAGWRKAKNCK